MAWRLCRAVHRMEGSSPLASRAFQQLLAIYPLHHLLPSSIHLALLSPPSLRDLPGLSASSALSFTSIRHVSVQKQCEAARSAFLHLILRGMATPTAADPLRMSRDSITGCPSLSTLLCIPTTSTRLSGGVSGDHYSLHALWWLCAEAASPSLLHSMLEWTVHAMYDVLRGHSGAERGNGAEEEVSGTSPSAYSVHTVMATLSPSSFSSVRCLHTPHATQSVSCAWTIWLISRVLLCCGVDVQFFSIALQLAQVLLCRLLAHPLKSRPSPTSTIAALSACHRLLLLYSHLLQLHLLASSQSPPPPLWRVVDSSAPPPSATEADNRRSKRRRHLSDIACHPFADLTRYSSTRSS